MTAITDFESFTAISLDSYNKKQSEKLGFTITAINVGLFSSIFGVKNLMDIWDRDRKLRK